MNPILILILCALAFGCEAFLQFCLFFMPGPYGTAYNLSPGTYYGLAIFYSLVTITGISLPFLAFCRTNKIRNKDDEVDEDAKNGAHRRGWVGYIALTALLSLFLMLNHADHEVMRYYGSHYSVQMLSTYNISSGTANFVWDTIANDARGAWSSLLLLFVPIVWFVLVVIFRKPLVRLSEIGWRRFSSQIKRWICLGVALVLGATTLFGFFAFVKNDARLGWTVLASRRQVYVAPFYVSLIHEYRESQESKQNKGTDYSNIAQQTQRIQNQWLEHSDDKNWMFVSPEKPYLKRYTGTCRQFDKAPNVILIIVETMRAWNIPEFNPNISDSPMPFLSSVLNQENTWMQKYGLKSAYWPQFMSNGQPTIDAQLAIHLGVAPHSSQTVASFFTPYTIAGFPNYLRKHGYHASFINSQDGGFDSWSIWGNRWYDKLYDPMTKDDKVFFGIMKDVISERMQTGQPWLVSGITFTNHIPFNVPEGGIQPPEGAAFGDRLPYTMRYNDAQLEAFMHQLGEMGALEHTVIFIVGDHGYDLGEYGKDAEVTGHDAIRANVTWVPLVMIHRMSDLPQGRQTTVGSQVDIAPTILDAVGICDDNSFVGHSLLSGHTSPALNCKSGNYALKTATHTAIFYDGMAPLLFQNSDPEQRQNLAKDHPEILEAMQKTADEMRVVTDYAYEHDKLLHVDGI